MAALAPRSLEHVGAPDVEQFVFRIVANVLDGVVAHQRERTRVGHAKVAARRSDAVRIGREEIGIRVEALAREQKLDHVAAVFGGDSALAIERRQFVDSQPRVVRVADIGECVDAPRRHPGDELAIVRQMLLETIGERIVPGHEVGNEGAPRERGLDLVRLDLAEHRGIDSRQLGLAIGG